MMRSIYGLKRGWWGSGLVALARLKSEQSHFVSPFHYIYMYVFYHGGHILLIFSNKLQSISYSNNFMLPRSDLPLNRNQHLLLISLSCHDVI